MSNIPRLLLINLASHTQGWSKRQHTHVHKSAHTHKNTLFPNSITFNEKNYTDQRIAHGQAGNIKLTKKKVWLTKVKRAQQLCQSWLGLIQSSATAHGQHYLPLHSHVHMPQCNELDLLPDPTENQLWEKKKKKKNRLPSQKLIQLTACLYKH